MAHASLAELLDSLDEALAKSHIDIREYEALDLEIKQAMRSANGLRRYLQHTPTPKEKLRFGPQAKKP